MSDAGLKEVANPSALFLGDRDHGAPGTAVFAGMEGTRPVLWKSRRWSRPRRSARRAAPSSAGTRTGLSMMLAVLEARCGVRLGANDIYLNVAGGLQFNEPAADLAVAAALISSLTASPLPADAVYFGEVSLAGAVRPVGHMRRCGSRKPQSSALTARGACRGGEGDERRLALACATENLPSWSASLRDVARWPPRQPGSSAIAAAGPLCYIAGESDRSVRRSGILRHAYLMARCDSCRHHADLGASRHGARLHARVLSILLLGRGSVAAPLSHPQIPARGEHLFPVPSSRRSRSSSASSSSR